MPILWFWLSDAQFKLHFYNLLLHFECINPDNMLYRVFIDRTTCVWPSADCTVKRLELQWTGASQTSSWFLARCCSVKDVLSASVYQIHRYKIPSARQMVKYNMLFSSRARKCCKHCQAVVFSSRLQLSFFHRSTTIMTKLDLFFVTAFGFF